MIRFDRLRAGYHGADCLHGISCAVPEGRLTALIGPNGCGKSTLLKCAAGLLKPSDGRIYLKDTPLDSLSARAVAQKIAFMPQSRPAPELSVRRLAEHGRYPHLKWGRSMTAADHEIVEAALVRAGAADLADRSVARLSGGERQRAYLSMMLAQEAPVLLLDEPTTYLDPGAQFGLMNLLRALADEGRTVVAVMHDLALALEYADSLLLMQHGQLIQTGSPGEIHASGSLNDVFNITAEQTPSGKYVLSERTR